MPTRNRTLSLGDMLDSIQETCHQKKWVDIWLYIDADDHNTQKWISDIPSTKYDFPIHYLIGTKPSSMGMMLNHLCDKCTTNPGTYIPCADDYIFITKYWDDIIRQGIESYPDRLALWYLEDSTAVPGQVIWIFLTAQWVNVTGRIITEFFPYWFDDNWLDQVSQLIQRKIKLDFKLQPQGGKGKTTRMRNLPFWQYFFCNTIEERIEDADRLRKAIYASDKEGYLRSYQASLPLVEKFKSEINRFNVNDLRRMEAVYSAESPDSAPSANYLQKELEAVELLYSKSTDLYHSKKYSEAIIKTENILLALQRKRNAHLLMAKCYIELNQIDQARYHLNQEIDAFEDNLDAVNLLKKYRQHQQARSGDSPKVANLIPSSENTEPHSEKSQETDKIDRAVSIIRNQHYDQFTEALDILKTRLADIENDLSICSAISFAAWVTNDADLCLWAGKRCIQINPQTPEGYLRIGLTAMGKQQYADAFITLSAGRFNCPNDEQIKLWHNLSEYLVKGSRIVRFIFDGIEYIFQLSVFNGQAMETAVSHVMGTLTEPQELKIVRKFIQRCDTIVEVGALVGNHTMFFAKTLQPRKIYVFDANPVAVEHINQTISLNDGPTTSRTRFVVRNAAVAAKTGRMRFFDHEVDVVCLDDVIDDKVNFIKIDVDGMEMEVLEGCRGIIARDQPKMMVEVLKTLENEFCTFINHCQYKIIDKVERNSDINFFVAPINNKISGITTDSVNPIHVMEHPDIKITAFFLSSREAYRPTLFSTNEVFCSPDCQTTSSGGVVKTIQSQAGVFDIRQIIDQLPPNQQPELIIVKTDATGRNFPVNLKQYNCPKLFVLGDTHHLNRPIQTLLTYAAQENFDCIISDHDRQHLHFFKEAGFQNVYWIPCLNIYPHEQPVIENKMYDVTFVGQVGRWHPNRKTVLNYLKSNGIAVNIMQAPHEQAAEIYAKSLINLNISLNGDMNLRIFEILSSGGFLLTDRLSKESGLEMIFKDGEHLVCYDSPEDLLEKIRYYLNHPQEAKAIAQKGYEEYKRRHTPEVKTNELMDYIFKGQFNPLYDITQDKRSLYLTSSSRESLFAKIAFYEFVQNLHLHNMAVTLLFTPSVDPRILCDLSDLPRLKMYIRDNGSQIPAESISLFHSTDIVDRLHTITEADIRNVQGAWDAVVVTASDLALDTLEDFLIATNFKLLLISDGLTSIESEPRQKLTDFLKMTGFETISDTPLAYHWKNKTACGEYFFSQNRTSEALKCFERALLDNPADEDALNNLGVVSYNFKNFPAAENFFIRAANLNRRNKNTLDNLIQNYMATEQFENAVGILKERIFMGPEQPDAYSLLGLCHDRLGHPNEAYNAYQNAKKLGGDAFPIPPHIVSDHDNYVAAQNLNASKNTLRKILVINNLYPPQELGGYGRLLFDFTNILRKRGHSIYVLTSDTPYLGNTVGDAPDVDRSLELFGGWQGGVCKSIENREEIIRIIRKNLSKLQQVLNEFQPDICLLGNIDFLSKNIMDPILEKKIPVVHHLGNQSPGYTVAETPKSRLYHLATASNWLKNVIKNDGYPLKDISVIYPGALVEEFRMRIPPAYDRLRIAYASIVLPYKGPHFLINALKKLNDLGIDFSCSMAGTTTDENFVKQLKEFIAIHGMDNKIHFPGFLSREALKDLFACHNVLVFPSVVKEAFGISQVEAMAAGLTVITTGTGGAKEVVEHGVSGIIFKSEDDASLADALIGLAKDTRRWGQIALAGQRRAMELFDIEHSVDALESCFSRLLKSKRD
jgi:FkbM family methyltransferase